MNLLPKSREEFSHKDYWNYFFQKRGAKSFEWYGEYPELCGLLHKYVKPKDVILMIGCGNSTISADLYDVGYRNITNIDISHVVIRQMKDSNAKQRPEMVYEKMDALNTTYKDEQFSVVLDKGTLDALMPDDSTEVKEKITQLFNEIGRLLRVGGRYVCVSLLQEHILSAMLAHFPAEGWMFRVSRCLEAERKEDNDQPTMPVFVIVCTKFKKMPGIEPVLEVSADGIEVERVPTAAEVVSAVRGAQQSSMVCNRLAQGSVSALGEMRMDLHRGAEDQPRYTVHVIDQAAATGRTSGKRYAAFIVPLGRETEWLFSTPSGRIALVKSAGYDRLAIVTLHRDHTYASLEAVQAELTSSIRQLSPAGVTADARVPYLSLGADVNQREVIFRGTSALSGDFVVEDVQGDGNSLNRRLVFLSNQSVIQSEARLKLVKTRRGKPKKVVDVSRVACEHHTYMTVGVAIATRGITGKSRVAIIGLGGGGLCSFIKHYFDKVLITAVDIDLSILEVAEGYFGLVQDNRLNVVIDDGVQFLTRSAAHETDGKCYEAILFDVDSKDQSVGMSCPPSEFLQPALLFAVKHLLKPKGVFVLNLVCRKSELRSGVVATLATVFAHIYAYQLEEDVNEVIFCSDVLIDPDTVVTAANLVNNLPIKNKSVDDTDDNIIDVTTFLSSLKIEKS